VFTRAIAELDRELEQRTAETAPALLEGAQVDEKALRELQAGAPGGMRSSMQKDIAAGRRPELDAIAGPILRGGQRHGIPVPATDELARLVEARASWQLAPAEA